MYQRDIHILMYHHVAPVKLCGGLRPFVVSPERFRMHLDLLQDLGCTAVSLGSVFERLIDGLGLPTRAVALTFDDCPTSLLEHAVPELIQRRMTGTFFVPAGKLGRSNDWDSGNGYPPVPLMGEREVRELSAAGFEIGSHGMSHMNLRTIPWTAAERETRESREVLEDLLSVPVRVFAYPFGEYPRDHARLCRDAGYDGACSIFSPAKHVLSDRYAMRRVLVHTDDTPLRLRLKLTRVYLRYRAWRDPKIVAAFSKCP